MTRWAAGRCPWATAAVAAMAVIALLLHLPGQLSVDSVIALYEAKTGHAFSWTPTFQSALLAWLGGGLQASALHVGAVVLATAGALLVLLPGRDAPRHRRWAAAVLAVNPLLWMMVGVIWRDVLLGTAMLVVAAALLRLRRSTGRTPAIRAGFHVLVAVAIAVAALARPQGVLLAVAAWAGYAAWMMAGVADDPRRGWRWRSAWLLAPLVLVAMLAMATDATIRPTAPGTRTMDGVGLVMAYDIVGTLAHSERLRAVALPPLDDERRVRFVDAYDPTRIDPLLATPGFRDWIIDQRAEGLWPAWRGALGGDPRAYLAHRASAAGALLGTTDVRRCLPGYWGVAGLPDMLASLGLEEAMDGRDRWLGRQAAWLAQTPWFWNASYLALLLVLMPAIARSARVDPVPLALGLGALAFTTAYLATTVACDVRYLYPLATLATALALDRLGRPAPKAESGESADLR